jgi:hypothetical protein
LKIIKKTTAIFLIALLGFNSFGLFFFYWGKIELCKIKAQDFAEGYYQLREKKLTIFSSGAKEFQLINDHEILAKGNFYDIVKTEISGGKTLYYTLSDDEEDAYLQQLSAWGKSNSEEQSLPTKTVGLHIAKYFDIKEHSYSSLNNILRLHSNVKSSNDLFLYISPLKNIFSPPPNNFLS